MSARLPTGKMLKLAFVATTTDTKVAGGRGVLEIDGVGSAEGVDVVVTGDGGDLQARHTTAMAFHAFDMSDTFGAPVGSAEHVA
jgi:hypothetical protein